MSNLLQNIGLAGILAVLGSVLGIAMILWSAAFLPRIINRLTPNLDEEKEIARGNAAVAEYFGRIVAACIIGVSIVVAAAVVGGIVAACAM